MDTLHFQTGGFPMSTERLASMQECWKTINDGLVAITGGDRTDCYVVSGCGVLKTDGNGDAYYDGSTDGFIVVRGELLPFKAGRGDYVVIKTTTTEELAYQDGNTKTFRTSRYATLQMTPDSSNLTIYDFDPDNGRRSFSTLWDIAARKTALNAALNSIASLQQAVATLNTLIGNNETDTAASLTALQKQLVPKGTIVMWSQALPLNVANKEAVISGMGAAYGYVPCIGEITLDWSSNVTAWKDYINELLPGCGSSIVVSGSKKINFTKLSAAAGITIPDLSGRFPLGCNSSHQLGVLGGEEKHALTEAEMPTHQHGFSDMFYPETAGELEFSNGAAWSENPDGTKVGSHSTDNNNNAVRVYTHKTFFSGEDEPHNNMPPYYPLNFLIKVI